MIKLSLPQYDPLATLMFQVTFYPLWSAWVGDVFQQGRGMSPDESPGGYPWDDEGRLQVDSTGFAITMYNATNEFASFRPLNEVVPADATGAYVLHVPVESFTNGLDGSIGWFSMSANNMEVVDLEVFYTPVVEDGERTAQGSFV